VPVNTHRGRLQISVNLQRFAFDYPGSMNEDDFSRLPPAAQAYIRELESRNRQLGERIAQLEEQFRLAQSQRFAPSSEKLRDRVFDEAEQIAATEAHDDDVAADTFTLPDTGLPDAPQPPRRSPGRKPLPAHLPRRRIEYDLPDDQKICPCCEHELHRMGEEISEQLHIEAKASVLQHVRFKYACRHCEHHAERTPVITAPMPCRCRMNNPHLGVRLKTWTGLCCHSQALPVFERAESA
jgi:hypothetical protein